MEKNRAIPAVFLNQLSGDSFTQSNKAIAGWELEASNKLGRPITGSVGTCCTTCSDGKSDDSASD